MGLKMKNKIYKYLETKLLILFVEKYLVSQKNKMYLNIISKRNYNN
jgi:hypothetical protein